MKRTSACCILLCLFNVCLAQLESAQWKWISGSPLIWQLPSYGSLGVPGVTNRPQGRTDAFQWTDTASNFWLYGGVGFTLGQTTPDFSLGDLWKYSPKTGRWAWEGGDSLSGQRSFFGTQGVPSPASKPGNRRSGASWTDKAGNLWLFSGYEAVVEFTSGRFGSDLWKYDQKTKLWTWINGDTTNSTPGIYGTRGVPDPANRPFGRRKCVTWTDHDGMLWLFGGEGAYNPSRGQADNFNDLWRLDPGTGIWTWIAGDNRPNSKGTYGTKGISRAENQPKARHGGLGWIDNEGALWMYGGHVFENGYYNDLWKFSIAKGEWTWISGDSLTDRSATYGLKGLAAPSNQPGGRSESLTWTDLAGNLWLFGGNWVRESPTRDRAYSDVWKYDVQAGLWTWMSGDNVFNTPPNFGAKNTFAPTNNPGSRFSSIGWRDKSGNFWLFGGEKISGQTTIAGNDLWEYDISTGQWAWNGGEPAYFFEKNYGMKGQFAPENTPGDGGSLIQWKGQKGRFWLYDGFRLWKFDPSRRQWAWMSGEGTVGVYGTKGVSAPSNTPGLRYQTLTLTDKAGNLWLFGGSAQGNKSDLWKYSPAANEWTWVSGVSGANGGGIYGFKGFPDLSNRPGARNGSIGWMDTLRNSIWIFGGVGYDPIIGTSWKYNDLWKYSISSGEWTWVSGDNLPNRAAVYGMQGIPSVDNKPPPGLSGTPRMDQAGDLWMTYGDNKQELWRFTVATGQWTWISGKTGTPIVPKLPTYGKRGVEAPSNTPGTRRGFEWEDSEGNQWFFGGGYSSPSTGLLYYNDIWRYNVTSNQWTWMAGDSIPNVKPEYGLDGAQAQSIRPGGRSSLAWLDDAGKLFIFGGTGLSTNAIGRLNDVWELSLPESALPVTFSHFTAFLRAENVMLDWTTAQEQNSSHFIIERSFTGAQWESIGQLAASGTSNSSLRYAFTDFTPAEGINFYRIAEFDRDGKFIHSSVASVVVRKSTSAFDIVKNPVGTMLTMRIQSQSNQKIIIQIRDMGGNLVLTEPRSIIANIAYYNVDIRNLVKGNYIVTIFSNHASESKKFVKQ